MKRNMFRNNTVLVLTFVFIFVLREIGGDLDYVNPGENILGKHDPLTVDKKTLEKPESDGFIGQKPIQRPEGEHFYNLALKLLPSASKDTATIGAYISRSIDESQKVDQAFHYLKQAANRGHQRSMELVAWAQLIGPLPLNIDAAKELFLILSKEGIPSAQTGLGFLHANGLSVKLSPASAILFDTFGSGGGSLWSRMALGYRYWKGVGVEANCEKALEQYKIVAEVVASEFNSTGTGLVFQRTRLLDELDAAIIKSHNGTVRNATALVIAYFTMLAKRGDTHAQVDLGQFYYYGGYGSLPNYNLAVSFFQKAAYAANPTALSFLGKMYLEGNDAVEADNSTALRWFERAAGRGSPIGMTGLGFMHLTGRGMPVNFTKAYEYFSQAADLGDPDAQFHLGNMHSSNEMETVLDYRIPKNVAIKYYRLAAESGHILAIYNLAKMYVAGKAVMRSCETAVELYKSVAERGKWSTLFSEAHIEIQENRFSAALIKLLLLSDLGYASAQNMTANLFERGEIGADVQQSFVNISSGAVKISTPINENTAKQKYVLPGGKSSDTILARALQYWSRAAKQGFSYALVRVGDFYFYGLGIPVDYKLAAVEYREASEKKYRNPEAMFKLSQMYDKGLGVKQSSDLAKRYHDMATEIVSAEEKLKDTSLDMKNRARNGHSTFIEDECSDSSETSCECRNYFDMKRDRVYAAFTMESLSHSLGTPPVAKKRFSDMIYPTKSNSANSTKQKLYESIDIK